MFKTILLLLLLAIAIGCWIYARRITKQPAGDEYHVRTLKQVALYLKITSAVCAFLLVILAVYSFTFVTGAKQDGVLLTFGHPSDHAYKSGLHFKLPWQRQVTVDGKVKGYSFSADKDQSGFDAYYPPLPAILGTGSGTEVTATLRWQVNEPTASDLYANYGTNDPTSHYGQVVIRSQFRQVVADVVRQYNPITQLEVLKNSNANQVSTATFAPDYDAMSTQAQAELQQRVGNLVAIQSVSISQVPLDSATQNKLAQFIQEQAASRTAAQQIVTNTNLKQANGQLESSLEKSPGLLTKQCLDEVTAAQHANYTLPQTFNCALFGVSNSSVILPAQGK